MSILAHGATDTGGRAANEDALLVDLAHGLFVVADGMGGHAAGEVASNLAVTVVRDVMASPGASPDQLGEAVRQANDRILDAVERNAEYAGMGTTVTAAIVRGDRLVFVSVGDSRMYRWRGGVLTQMTADDSWLAHARATGAEISEDEALRHPMRHVLTEVVGVRPDLHPELQVDSIEPGDVLLLCSDGLHGVLEPAVIAGALGDVGDPAAAVEQLIGAALERGTTDNLTSIVIRL
jgi:serine/threonine protein phosphatase PrpC